MSTWIKWTLWLTITGGIIAQNVVCAMLSEQYSDFLKLFFWEFPIALIRGFIPGL